MEPRQTSGSKKMSRRSFLRLGVQVVSGLIGASALTGVYAVYGERFWYKVTRLTLRFPKLPASFDGMRIVQFSDVHHGRDFSTERVADVAERIQKLNPDMVCFTGDLFDEHHGQLTDVCTPILAKLQAPLGKWAVLGNHDYGIGARGVTEQLSKAGFTVLNNEHRFMEKGGEQLLVAGVTDMVRASPSMEEALSGADNRGFTLLLSHAPDFADEALPYGPDLQLSGHSHGGQIRVPIAGSLFTPEGARRYIIGLYELGDGKMKLYTNRGLGTSVIPIRFLCRPEITVLTLKRA